MGFVPGCLEVKYWIQVCCPPRTAVPPHHTHLLPDMSVVGAEAVASPVPAGSLQKTAHTWLSKPWCLHWTPFLQPVVAFVGLSPVALKLADGLWGQLWFMGESGQVLPGGLRVLEQDSAAS